jgi:hypothetical protein
MFAKYTLVLFLRQYTLVTTIVHAEDKQKGRAAADIEKGPDSEEDEEKDVRETEDGLTAPLEKEKDDTTATGSSESKAGQKE